MPGNSKARNDYRRAEKRKRKAQQKALYISYRDSGNNTKSKRVKLRKLRTKRVKNLKHKSSDCGNNACIKCYEVKFTPFLNKNKVPIGMPQWIYQIYKQERR